MFFGLVLDQVVGCDLALRFVAIGKMDEARALGAEHVHAQAQSIRMSLTVHSLTTRRSPATFSSGCVTPSLTSHARVSLSAQGEPVHFRVRLSRQPWHRLSARSSERLRQKMKGAWESARERVKLTECCVEE